MGLETVFDPPGFIIKIRRPNYLAPIGMQAPGIILSSRQGWRPKASVPSEFSSSSHPYIKLSQQIYKHDEAKSN